MAWRRERVGRTSTALKAGMEKKQVCGVDPVAVGEVPVWTRRR
jgi:hypothetical protein